MRVLGAVVILLAAACATVVPDPPATTSPSPAATADCYEFIELAIPSTMPKRDILDEADVVALGMFEGYGDAVWTTPDETRPTPDAFRDGARLVTPLEIDVERMLRGDDAAAARAVESGGSSGCDIVDYGWADLGVGRRYVFLLVPLIDATGAPSDRMLLLDAWPVAEDDSVFTGDERLSDLSSIERRIERTDSP